MTLNSDITSNSYFCCTLKMASFVKFRADAPSFHFCTKDSSGGGGGVLFARVSISAMSTFSPPYTSAYCKTCQQCVGLLHTSALYTQHGTRPFIFAHSAGTPVAQPEMQVGCKQQPTLQYKNCVHSRGTAIVLKLLASICALHPPPPPPFKAC